MRAEIGVLMAGALLLVGFIACSDVSTPKPPTPTLSTVTVTVPTSVLRVGQSEQAQASARDTNGNAISASGFAWLSSDATVAKISATGRVTAVAPGSATITATAGTQSGTTVLTVTTVPVGAVSIKSSTTSLNRGQSLQLTAVVADSAGNTLANRTVTWSSSPTSVATISASGLVTAVAAGTATITATADGVSGTTSITVNAGSSSGTTPTPGAGSTILLDLRQSLQQTTTIDNAFALFGTVDHTPYRGPKVDSTTGGWSFTANADGNGLHAFRADWGYGSGDQGIRVIDYLPQTTTEFYAQWKGRIGRYPFDTDANGAANSYAFWPRSNSCKRALFERPSNLNRVDFTVMRDTLEAAEVEMGQYNYVFYGASQVWNENSELGAAPFTTTVHVKAATTAGGTDGVAQVWINGTLVADLHNVPGGNEVFDRWEFPTICTNVAQAQSEYFWDILVWKP